MSDQKAAKSPKALSGTAVFIIVVLAIALGAGGYYMYNKHEGTIKKTGSQAGAAVDKAVEKTGEAVEKTGDAIKDTGTKMKGAGK